nr:retroviral-like aspartic protease family protein [Porphyrobacter sp. GA68]
MWFHLPRGSPAFRVGAAALLCASSSGAAWATAAEPVAPKQDGLVAIVPAIDLPAEAASAILLPDQQARPTTQVSIAGNGPYRFLVDTGAQATVIARDVAATLALPSAGTGTLVATGSQRTVDLVEVTGLGFANRKLNLPASPVLEREHLGADGILGLDTLQGMRVLIDFGARRITVADPHDERTSGAYEIIVRARKRLGQMIITDATIDGVRATVIVDTGASLSIGNRALQRRLRARSGLAVQGTDVNGVSFVTDLRVARRIEIGSLTIDSVQIGFADSPAFAALNLAERPALILGMNALQGLDRLALDFAARKIMFDLPRGASNKQARWSRF